MKRWLPRLRARLRAALSGTAARRTPPEAPPWVGGVLAPDGEGRRREALRAVDARGREPEAHEPWSAYEVWRTRVLVPRRHGASAAPDAHGAHASDRPRTGTDGSR